MEELRKHEVQVMALRACAINLATAGLDVRRALQGEELELFDFTIDKVRQSVNEQFDRVDKRLGKLRTESDAKARAELRREEKKQAAEKKKQAAEEKAEFKRRMKQRDTLLKEEFKRRKAVRKSNLVPLENYLDELHEYYKYDPETGHWHELMLVSPGVEYWKPIPFKLEVYARVDLFNKSYSSQQAAVLFMTGRIAHVDVLDSQWHNAKWSNIVIVKDLT